MWVCTKMIGLAGIEAMSRSAKAWQWEVASSQAEGIWVSIFSGLGIPGCKHDISQTCRAGNKKRVYTTNHALLKLTCSFMSRSQTLVSSLGRGVLSVVLWGFLEAEVSGFTCSTIWSARIATVLFCSDELCSLTSSRKHAFDLTSIGVMRPLLYSQPRKSGGIQRI